MTVPVRGTITASKDGKFTQKHASTIGERLIALEKALAGAGVTVAAPAAPAFGGGVPGPPPGVPPGPPGGVTDHGALTGLEDNDHPQYVQHLQQTPPQNHVHRTSDVVDFDQWEQVLMGRIFGG